MALGNSVGDLASTLVSMARTRLELFALELSEQKSRLLTLVAMLFGGLVFLILALLVFSIMVALYFWPTEHRYLALGVLVVIYAVAGCGLLLGVRNWLKSDDLPFSNTLDELQRDLALVDRLRDRATDDSKAQERSR